MTSISCLEVKPDVQKLFKILMVRYHVFTISVTILNDANSLRSSVSLQSQKQVPHLVKVLAF